MKDYEVKIKNEDGLLMFTAFVQNHHLRITAINQAMNEFTLHTVPMLFVGDLTIECNEV